MEGYWLHEDGTKTAYQAKYWTRTGDIAWAQIDDSVKTALQLHPEIRTYIVALACDLTDRSGKKRKGKPGWDHWKTHSDNWKRLTEEARFVNFVPWTKFELGSKVNDLLPEGAIKYWFDETLLSEEWFDKIAEIAISDLGLRYSPTTHVDRDIDRYFQSLLHDPHSLDEVLTEADLLLSRWRLVEKWLMVPENSSPSEEELPSLRIERRIEETNKFSASGHTTEISDCRSWADEKEAWWGVLQLPSELLSRFDPSNATGVVASRIQRRIDEVQKALDQLEFALDEKALALWDEESLLVSGTFGTGKSHAMARLLEASISTTRPAVMLLGQQFEIRSPRPQVIDMLDLRGSLSWTEFLDCLNAAAEAQGKLGVLLLDAINEGQGCRIWANYMAGMAAEIRGRPHLRLVVSCRSEYETACWPNSLTVKKHTIREYTEAEFQEVCVRLMDEQGISRPTAAFLPSQFYNPLILNTACQSLKSQGRTEFPGSLVGLQDFVHLYLEGVDGSLQSKLISTRTSGPGMQDSFLALANSMVERGERFVEEREARGILNENVPIPPPAGQDWLDVLIETGSLRLDPLPSEGSLRKLSQVVRFAFQLHEEYFIAQDLLSLRNATTESTGGETDTQDPLARITNDPKTFLEWRGVVTMLSVLCPERMGSEIFDLPTYSAEDSLLASMTADCFLQGLSWRRPESVNARTTELLFKLFRARDVYRTLLTFAAIPDHPWNSELLDRQLSKYPDIANRDSVWTVALNHDPGFKAVAEQLIDWSLGQSKGLTPHVAQFASIGLAWFLTASNRLIRDRATKALVSLFRKQPCIMPDVLRRFHQTNDPYVLERVMAAIYGACCALGGAEVAHTASTVYQTIFSLRSPPLHLLTRDYALGTIERAQFLDVLPSQIDLARCFPPHDSPWPLASFSNTEIDELADSVGDVHREIAYSCTTEYGRGTGRYGDFGRYELENRVREFSGCSLDSDPASSGARRLDWDGEFIGNWVAKRAYDLGWTSDLFPDDRSAGIPNYSRNRAMIERIGKKYQWIAMFELLANLSDHVWCGAFWNTPRKYRSALDLPYCRDFDPTVPIDKCDTSQEYNRDAALKFSDLSSIDDLSSWPYVEKEFFDFKELTTFVGEDHREWYRLYGFAADDMTSEAVAPTDTSFVRVCTICVPNNELENRLASLRELRLAGESDYWPTELFQDAFLLEAGWRNRQDIAHRIDHQDDADLIASLENGSEHLDTVREYRWESSHEDLPSSVSHYLLSPWIAKRLGLAIDPDRAGFFRDQCGEVGFFSRVDLIGANFNVSCVIDAQKFEHLLHEMGLACVWVLGGGRDRSLGFGSGKSRSFSGLAWFESDEMKTDFWVEDN